MFRVIHFVALAVVLGYSYTKRFTALCHLVLGIGLSLAPDRVLDSGHWENSTLAPLLFLRSGSLLGSVDLILFMHYRMKNSIGGKQVTFNPGIFWSRKKRLKISRNLHLASSLFILAAGFQGQFHLIYFLGWAFFTGLLIYQHRLVNHMI
jgi:4-hydroxybenzoate polyprenyltransferase